MGTSSVEAYTSRSLSASLVSAVLEWLLILMLFFDSIFSFVITKCARFWKLTTPCLLCSRLDHIFGTENKGYLWNLICANHKLEISSLVFCHAHKKLVDVHGMCESCLFSFATINKSNAETYRLLVGKLGEDHYSDNDKDPLLGDQKNNTSGRRNCSCCNEPFVSRGFVRKLIQAKSSGFEAAELDIPLFISDVHCKEDTEESSNKEAMFLRHIHRKGSDEDNHLPHFRYTELKITSDTESDGNGSSLDIETPNLKEHLTVQGVHVEPNFISLSGDLTSTKLIEPTSAPEPLVLEPLVHLGDTPVPAVCSVPIGHGLDKLNAKQAESNGDFSSPVDLISLDNMLHSSTTVVTAVEVLEKPVDVTRSGETETECRETKKAGIMPTKTSEAGSEAQPVLNDASQMIPNVLELGDAYKLAVGNRSRQLSGKLSEQWIGKDSSKVSEDLRLLLSQLSFNRIHDQSRDMSPRLSINGDDQRNFDASSAVGLQILQKRISLERNESGLSLDGSIISEIEGENPVDRLKRQIEHDKKLMSCLYKELEEERNASAIAANQAMAMITRLQEEKATLHMEALQCLRMMEEQTEYDDDALQKANDLIAEKDKEIQDLEAELEFYKNNLSNELTMDDIVKTSDVKERDIRVVHLEPNQNEAIGYENPVSSKPISEEDGNDELLEFEDEKINIMQDLKKLEKMLHLFSNNGVTSDLANGEYCGEEVSVSSEPNDLNSGSRKLEDGEHDARTHAEDRLHSPENASFSKEIGEPDFSSLKNDMSNLNRRIEALEADKNFLEHTINSLRNGEEGLHFVQEIASHLRELRKIGIGRS